METLALFRRSTATMVFVLLGSLLLPLAAAEEMMVEFGYAGPAAFEGRTVGSCEGNGLSFPAGVPASLAIESAGGVLAIVSTRVNYTVLSPTASPVMMPDADKQWSRTVEIPPGITHVSVASTGLVAVVPPLQGDEFTRPFEVSLSIESANLSSVREGIRTQAEFFWTASEGDEKPHLRDFAFPRWSRSVSFAGEARAKGDLLLYVREATIDFRDESFQLERWKTEEFNVTTPAVARRTVRFSDAFLELSSARLSVPPSAEIICGALHGRVTGGFVADRATGRAVAGSDEVQFQQKVLSMEGTFVLDETPEWRQGLVRSRAEGNMAVLGIDFAPVVVGVSSALLSADSMALWLLIVGAVLLALKNLGTLVGTFYSRFGRDRVLDNRSRDLVYQAVVQNPGMALSRLTEVTPYHLSTVTYHVRVLQRVGLVGTLRQGRSIRVLPKDMLAKTNLPKLREAWDPRMAFLIEQVRPQPISLREIVRTLAERFGITPQASYAIVNDAVAANLVRRTGSGKAVVVECMPASS